MGSINNGYYQQWVVSTMGSINNGIINNGYYQQLVLSTMGIINNGYYQQW